MTGPDDGPGREERTLPARPGRFVAAALLATVLAAAGVAGERPGLGVLVVALALAAAAFAAGGGPRDRWSVVWGALALALAAAPVLRDASWVVVPALGGAIASGSLAVAGGRTWPGVALGTVGVLVRAPRGPAAVVRAAATAAPPASRGPLLPVLRGATLAAALVVAFGLLFASSDAAFAELAGRAIPTGWALDPIPARLLVGAVTLALAGGLAAAAGRGASIAGFAAPARRLGPAEWTIALGALVTLFAAFVAVQAAALSGGVDTVLRTAGLTYAEYARQGFGQLLVAAALTLAVVAAARRYAAAEGGALDRRLRALLAALCVLTLVVLASAIHRLDLYQAAFGATRLRFAADAAMVWLGALLALVLVALAHRRDDWLPRASVLATVLALLLVVIANPDARVAERNLARLATSGDVDAAYLRSLSADAAPALARFPVLRPPAPAEDGWGGFSWARARAR